MARYVWTALALMIFVVPAEAGRRNRCHNGCNSCTSSCNSGCGMGCGMGCGYGGCGGCGYAYGGCGSPCGGVATPATAPAPAPRAMPSGAVMPTNPVAQVVYEQPRRIFNRNGSQMYVSQPQMVMAGTPAPPAAGAPATEGTSAPPATAPVTSTGTVMMASNACCCDNWNGNYGGNNYGGRRGLLFRRR